MNQKVFSLRKEMIAVGNKFWIQRIFCNIKNLGVNRKLEKGFYKKIIKPLNKVQSSRIEYKWVQEIPRVQLFLNKEEIDGYDEKVRSWILGIR